MINFLNIGNNEVLAVNPDLAAKIDGKTEETVTVTYVEFYGIKQMYGAFHCATQVSRVAP
jgi:hypothetical protein